MSTGSPSDRSATGPRWRPRWRDLCPGLVTLSTYRREWLRLDALAGVTVAAYAIPQVMAYAQIAGLPPAVGLVAVVGPALAYLVLGSSRQLSVGPESTVALMTGAALATSAGSGTDRATLAAAFAVAVGVLCLLGWLGRLGFLAELLSRPVLVGYMAGVAALMILSQIEKITGIPASGDSPPAELVDALRHLGEVHWPTLTLATVLLVVLLVGQRLAPRLPHPLIVVLLGAAAVWALDLRSAGVPTVGVLPRTLPTPALPDVSMSQVLSLVVPALGIAVVGYSDNVLTARAFASRQGERIDANQEFLALGVSNMASGLFSGMPVSSSGSRTAIADSVGGRTQVLYLFTVATVVGAVLFAGPLLAAFPQAALGALVVYAALRLVEVGEIRRVGRFRRSELLLLVTTTAGVVVLGALNGILLAIVLSLGDLLRRVARPHDGILGFVRGLAGMHDVDDYPTARQVPGLVVYRYDSPLFFANAEDFRRRATEAVDDASYPVEWLLINAEANVEVDLTSMDTLCQLVAEMSARGVTVALARVKQDLLADLRASGLAEQVGEDHIFPTLPTAVEAYLEWHEVRHGRLHPFREA
ncbi:MAG TPA: SulP family inorganic anion transporter [Dermatophilaceae bacterium]|nr:SulP family inorganic anion transporter [Dermatophilaceae bacterium]